MSRTANPCVVHSLQVEDGPYRIEGKVRLRLAYKTPTGIWKELKLVADVRDVLCVRRTVRDLSAKYKQLAQELANEL